jgi:RND family efflux transporter MFP subunit
MDRQGSAVTIDMVFHKEPSIEDFSRLVDLASAEGLAAVAGAWVLAVAPLFARLPGVGLDLVCVHLADDRRPEGRDLGRAPQRRLPTPLLTGAIVQAFERGQVIVTGAVPGQGVAVQGTEIAAVVLPLALSDRIDAVIGVEATLADPSALAALLSAVQAAAGWLMDALRADEVGRADQRLDAAGEALHTIVAVVEAEGFAVAAQAAVSDLALRYHADRVAFGLLRRDQMRVQAISNVSEFKKSIRDVRLIEAAMNEAVDQETALVWPTPAQEEAAPLCLAHAEMDRVLGGASLFTVPMYDGDQVYAATLFERHDDRPFLPDELDLIEATVTVIAPILKEKQANDAWIGLKVAQAAKIQLKRLIGPQFFLRKLIVLGLVLTLLTLLLGRQMAVVPASATVEGRTQRVITASFDGFIAEALAREGDVVQAGETLVRLDDRDLALERLRLVTAAQQERLELDKAIATRDRAQTAIREARIRQAKAQIKLIDSQLDRVQLRAPFDGLVISGDLNQSIGASVSKGEPLMTVAPLDDFRVVLAVDESRINDLVAGQTAWLRLTALPDQVFAAHISEVQPVARYGDGKTTYRVVALLDQSAPELQHGMQGVARVEVEERSLWSVWLTPMFDRLRLLLWSWWPV